MNGNRRARIAAAATVVGLAGLGGAALGTNHGLTAPVASSVNGRAPIVTSASGSTTTTAASSATTAHRAPIVSRTSAAAGGAGATVVADD